MITFVLRRLLLFVPTLWAIATLTFFMIRLAPGGPFMAEKDIPETVKQQLTHRYGLDRPLGEQYVTFLANAARFDFGPSYRFPARSVRDIILEGLPVSAELGGWALLFALLVGVPLGVLAASTPSGTPTSSANSSAQPPSSADTGRPSRMMSRTERAGNR